MSSRSSSNSSRRRTTNSSLVMNSRSSGRDGVSSRAMDVSRPAASNNCVRGSVDTAVGLGIATVGSITGPGANVGLGSGVGDGDGVLVGDGVTVGREDTVAVGTVAWVAL